MALPVYVIRSALRCLRKAQQPGLSPLLTSRTFKTTGPRHDEAALESSTASTLLAPPPALDPSTVATPREERALFRAKGVQPIGSRRRRAALQSSDNVPFEQMPYQCFQEARKVLQTDREEKLAQIVEMRKRIAHWQDVPASDCGGEFAKKGKLVRMHKHLEELKILADINDPVIKKRFEDGEGDMNRPIYRHLADKKWREYKRLLLMQRISQHHIVPDMFSHLDPTAEVSLGFGRRNVQPGEFVDSRVSEIPARLTVQCFDKGERFVTIAVVDPDVPDAENDSFTSRCHFLAVNIPISPTSTSVPLAKLKNDDHIVHSWLPPYAEKGAPYHRLAIFVIQQDKEAKVDLEALRNSSNLKRNGFSMRKLLPQNTGTPIGVDLFRSQWDEGTDGIILRHGIKGANVEFTRKKPEKLPYKKKDGARYR